MAPPLFDAQLILQMIAGLKQVRLLVDKSCTGAVRVCSIASWRGRGRGGLHVLISIRYEQLLFIYDLIFDCCKAAVPLNSHTIMTNAMQCQETVDFVCQSILEKSMRTYTIRFPDSKQEGFTQEAQQKYLSEMVQKSPAVARLVDMMTIMQGLLSVNPRARPSMSSVASYVSHVKIRSVSLTTKRL